MVKVSSFALFLAATVISLTGAAPVSTSTSDDIKITIPTPVKNDTPVPTSPTEQSIETRADVDQFSSSVKHQGKATWFTHGYGACNIYWDGNKEPVVALNAHQMGTQSWGNPVCDRKVRVYNRQNPSKSVVARIVDKCPGDECAWGSLDLSPFAFKKLGHLDTGIIDISWNYV
ncbi:RlpA-like double-psi beta-barrel-protein domain-containing protein-containing protein [Gamsiella multidivaricata]|uniref:RlpA-like double-psi beta-barrel-protein domain-containing protein-containing protein n=1 Tax=Gamsiella multidivaricata TaxID=101098 RepID=UPI0022205993|nr:RlpA-like double-psi beta-barrel-protein domain-containing protein-containing protein [Gamsiella multidivaricata]KAG0364545.1 hypothetical protein BGZ54_007400 [Gamsiella multidivaricata]KAI7816989.1 RlpA-like double-psi beta-barrel-protein domain-containing protein-containing protein [Gamsiella multidivaricata]